MGLPRINVVLLTKGIAAPLRLFQPNKPSEAVELGTAASQDC
jgi:hypothetical protein